MTKFLIKNTRIINLTTKNLMTDIRYGQSTRKKIEDEETVQLQNLSTDTEKINRKEINNE